MTAQPFGDIKLPKTNLKRIQTAYNKHFKALLEEGAIAFVKAVYGRIPVYTGMARASVRPLANYLKVNVPIFGPYVRASRISKGESQGAFEFEYGPIEYRLTFKSAVFHYWLNENFYMNDKIPLIYKTPWNSLYAGVEAFVNTVTASANSASLPPMEVFINYYTVRI